MFPSPSGRRINRLEPLILAVGIILRSARFLDDRPLWFDEVRVALNVLTRGPHEFFRSLDYFQMVPLGFLWSEWLVTRVAGTGEQALRLVPFVAGIAGLVAFARLARRLLNPGPALLATALASLSPLLIYYSSEVKSYSIDFLGAVVMMHCTLTILAGHSREAWIRWSVAAALSSLLSTAAPFYVLGCAIVIVASPPVGRSLGAVRRIVAAGAPAAFIFAIQLFTVYRSSGRMSLNTEQTYWTEDFADTHPLRALVHGIEFVRDFTADVLFAPGSRDLLPPKIMMVVLALCLVGAVALGRRSPGTLGMLLASGVLAGVASIARYWPLIPRLMLFFVPAVLVILAAGVAAVARLAPGKARAPVHVVASVALIVLSLLGAPAAIRADARFLGVSEAIRDVLAHADSQSTVYVSADIRDACRYYLFWHPDRGELGVVGRDPGPCALGQTHTVVGTWPQFVERDGDLGPVTLTPEWVEDQVQPILASAGTEIWLLIGDAAIQQALPARLEGAGATRIDDRTVRGVRILMYRRQ